MLPCRSARLMFEHVNPKNGQPAPLISQEVYDIIMQVCELGFRLHTGVQIRARRAASAAAQAQLTQSHLWKLVSDSCTCC